MHIDIRKEKVETIDVVRFTDHGVLHHYDNIVFVSDSDDEYTDVAIKLGTLDDAVNLQAAIQKAIDLGWWK